MPIPQIAISTAVEVDDLRNSTQVALNRLISHLNSAPIDKSIDANEFRIINCQWPANDKDVVNVEYLKDFVANAIKKRRTARGAASSGGPNNVLRTFGYGIARNLATGVDVAPHMIFTMPNNKTLFTLERLEFKCKTAPTGATVIADINFSGTSILAASPKLVVPVSDTTVQIYTTFTKTTFVDKDFLTLDVDQIGSSIPGSGLVITMAFKVD